MSSLSNDYGPFTGQIMNAIADANRRFRRDQSHPVTLRIALIPPISRLDTSPEAELPPPFVSTLRTAIIQRHDGLYRFVGMEQ